VGCENGIAHSVSREIGTAHSESGDNGIAQQWQWHQQLSRAVYRSARINQLFHAATP